LIKNSDKKSDGARTRSRSTNTYTEQPKIQEAFRMATTNSSSPQTLPEKTPPETTPPTPATEPPAATPTDIMKVLDKLDNIQSDNVSMKKLLNEIQNSLQTRIDQVESKVSTLANKTEVAINDNKSEIKTIKSTVTDQEMGLNFQGDKITKQEDRFNKKNT